MTWFRIDDGFNDHPKVDALEDGPCADAAESLWLRAGVWSAKHLTDGFIPVGRAKRLARNRKAPAELVRVGLWEAVDGGYQYHDWPDHQPTKEDVEAKRSLENARKARWRKGKSRKVSRVDTGGTDVDVHAGHPRPGDATETRDSALPDPTRPDPTRVDPPSAPPSELEARAEEHRHRTRCARAAFVGAIEAAGGEWQGDFAREFGTIGGLAAKAAPDDLRGRLDRWASDWLAVAEARTVKSWLSWCQATTAGTPWRTPGRRGRRSARLPPGDGSGFSTDDIPEDAGEPQRKVHGYG